MVHEEGGTYVDWAEMESKNIKGGNHDEEPHGCTLHLSLDAPTSLLIRLHSCMTPLNRPFLACCSVTSRRAKPWHASVWGLLEFYCIFEKK
jgi:hypothetical protein